MSSKDLRAAINAIAMDNTMAKDALAMENLSALKLILERQENELANALSSLEYVDATQRKASDV